MRKGIRTLAFGVVLLGAVSCETKVTNPGRVDDKYLSDRNAAAAMVSGAGRALSQGINWVGYTGAAVAREIHPAGSTGSFGISSRWQYGELNADDGDLDTHWEQMQRARWLAEEAVRRLVTLGPPGPNDLQTLATYRNLLQLAYLYAGFANKLLGENMCEAVFDGGAPQLNSEYFVRAEAAFTSAIGVTGGTPATIAAQAAAATAGRAASRVFLSNWTGATTDAATIATTMVYNMPYYNVGDDPQRNRIFFSSGNTRESGSAYRAHTQWNTWHLMYKYGSSTTLTPTSVPVMNDPRILIVTSSQPEGDAAIDCCGKVPFYPEAKYTASASPIRLASGREMLLVRAEAALRNLDVPGAMGFINQTRTAAGAPTITTTDVDCSTGCAETWRLLKRERGIELWLEARRLGDLRRWKAANTAGAYDPLESIGSTATGNPPSHLSRQDLCFPVSRSERRTNPNFQP